MFALSCAINVVDRIPLHFSLMIGDASMGISRCQENAALAVQLPVGAPRRWCDLSVLDCGYWGTAQAQ